MSASELVALVSGIGEGRALQLIDTLGGFKGLARAGMGEVAAVVGDSAAIRLMAALELGHRVLEEAAKEAPYKFPESKAVYAWSQARLALLQHEELWMLALDGRNALRAARLVAAGGLHGMHIGVRDVLRVALQEAASSYILVHNHPSNDPTPSREDVEFTRKIKEASDMIGTPIVDHVIVTRSGGFKSMHELGLLLGSTEYDPEHD